jgi:hypothetical protein
MSGDCLFNDYESIKRELKIRPIYECRCDERLETKGKEFTRLTYTGLLGGQEHLKIETKLIDEKIANTWAGEDHKEEKKTIWTGLWTTFFEVKVKKERVFQQ